MEWEFTPEDVVKARAGYSLADFRHGLAEEVRINLGVGDDAQQLRTFNLIYDMSYALATNKDLALSSPPMPTIHRQCSSCANFNR